LLDAMPGRKGAPGRFRAAGQQLTAMTKKEKFEQLHSGRTTGGSVLFQPILMHFAARFSGKTYAEFASDHRVLVECNLAALSAFDMDMVGLISDPYRETSAFGAKIEYIDEGVPRCLDTIVRTLDDVKALPRPDVHGSERTRDRIQGAVLYQQRLKGSVPVYGWIEGPLAEACDLAGISRVLSSLMDDPDFPHLLMDRCMLTAKDFAQAQIEAGCDIIGIGDAICSQISRRTYDEFVRERHREIVEFIHSQRALVKMHICGNITHLLPSLRDLGVDILDCDWQVDLDAAHRMLGDGIIRCGNINPVDIQERTEAELRAAARELLRREAGRRFILSGGCEITVNTPPGNLLALREASRQPPAGGHGRTF
jgi:MtaA/CmuA family methyltransferase